MKERENAEQIIVLAAEEGIEIKLRFLDYVEYNQVEYFLFGSLYADEEGKTEVFIYESSEEGFIEVNYSENSLFDELFEIFERRSEGKIALKKCWNYSRSKYHNWYLLSLV